MPSPKGKCRGSKPRPGRKFLLCYRLLSNCSCLIASAWCVEFVLAADIGSGVVFDYPEPLVTMSTPKAYDFASLNRLYEILEVTPQASQAQLKTAYRKIQLRCHPDKIETQPQSVKDAARRRFDEVQLAYQILTDKE